MIWWQLASSGSSGVPALVVYSIDEVVSEWAIYLRLLVRWAGGQGLQGQPRVAVIGAPPGPHISGVIGWLQGVDESARFSVADPIEELVAGLNTVEPDLLVVYPSLLPRLLEATRDGDLRAKPKLILTVAEPALPGPIALAQELWGCAVASNWAATEVGMLGTGDAVSDGIVLHDDHILVEAVTSDNKPVGHGQPADKVLVTTLSRQVQPLIRYEIADQLSIFEPRVGEPFRRAENVEGRLDDTFHYGDRLLHPSVVRSALAIPGVDEYRVTQD